MAIEQGWAIQSPQLIYLTTVRRTRSEAIDAFMSTRGKVWRYWQRKYHCRAVRVQVTDELCPKPSAVSDKQWAWIVEQSKSLTK